MSDNEQKKEPLQMASPTRLQLTKTVESGKVKQHFQHGRSKTVTVEVRKTRTFATGTGGMMVEVKQNAASSASASSAGRPDLSHLTQDEKKARLRALQQAEETRPAVLPPVPKLEERVEVEEGASASVTAEEVAKLAKESGKSRSAAPAGNAALPAAKPAVKHGAEGVPEERAERSEAKRAKLKIPRDAERRGTGKLTIAQVLGGQYEERMRSLASVRRQREKVKKTAVAGAAPQEKFIREVVIPEIITVQDLASRMAVRAVDVIKALMKLGMVVTVTQSIDADTAELVVEEFGHKAKRVAESDVENLLRDDPDDPESLRSRPPVVTIMGHVDHGKTSLLDALRKSDVVAGEAGGITQHVGAYQIDLGKGSKVTFLDTPGHEAFTAMRARGAKVTDIVVLVVAADDGIMEQTKEAISHAKAAGVPIVVAINKIDKPEANPARVRQELMQYELVTEEFGGDVMAVEVSAKQKHGLDKLVETILLQAEVLELKANPGRHAMGAVVEARLDQGKGVVATLLVQKGTLKVGDIIVAGSAYGRIRALTDDKGKMLKSAPPGSPVVVQGLNQVPEAGDQFAAVESEKDARDVTEYRAKLQRASLQVAGVRSLEQMFATAKGGDAKELPVIIKADVHGSAEAIAASLQKASTDEVKVRAIHVGVGGINESDVTLAQATGAIVIGFNVRAMAKAKQLAERDKIDIRYYSIIYNLVDDIKAALSGMLSPTRRENFLGYAEIRQVFSVSKAGKVAGCMVTEGVVKRGAKVRLLRDNVVIHEGTLKTLKRFKDDVREVKSGMECGMAFENYEDIREGDMIEAFEVEEVARTV